MKKLLILIMVIHLWLPNALFAKQELDPKDDLYLQLTKELRCTVCQNQTLYDSSASFAIDLKTLIREKIDSGENETEIKNFLVSRYGDFILYRPEFKVATSLLWGGPLLLIILGIFGVLRTFRIDPSLET